MKYYFNEPCQILLYRYEKDETKKLQRFDKDICVKEGETKKSQRFDKDICAKEGEKKNASGQYEGGTLRKKPSGENDEADPDVLVSFLLFREQACHIGPGVPDF